MVNGSRMADGSYVSWRSNGRNCCLTISGGYGLVLVYGVERASMLILVLRSNILCEGYHYRRSKRAPIRSSIHHAKTNRGDLLGNVSGLQS